MKFTNLHSLVNNIANYRTETVVQTPAGVGNSYLWHHIGSWATLPPTDSRDSFLGTNGWSVKLICHLLYLLPVFLFLHVNTTYMRS